jgi:isoleucyl-tRNA synthetase
VIDKYGAEILRLWVSAADYRDDIRISDTILKQLSDAYRRIRNTSRFMLGNLYDFDPARDALDYDQLTDLDRFTLHRLQSLVGRAQKAYETYEFHLIYHALHNFCALDLSAFYLDILKDRLYASAPASDKRRGAQTVIHIVLDTLARLMAPILAFTAEEVWQYMPARTDKPESVHAAPLPTVRPEWQDEPLAAKWRLLLAVRSEVTKALEAARVGKLIGHPLDAAVTLAAPAPYGETLAEYGAILDKLFIVSQVVLAEDDGLGANAYQSPEIEGLGIAVAKAPGAKCERCWIHATTVGDDPEHPTVCDRCRRELGDMAE